MQGHLRSILPQKGGVAPVDNNTVALFHYEQDAKDSIRGIPPIGERHALSLPGVAGEYIDLGNPALETLTNCTVEFWCKAESTARWLFMKGQSSGYYLMATNSANGFYHSNVGSPTMYVDGEPSNTFLKDGKWHHYAAVGLYFTNWTQATVSNYSTWEVHGSLSELRIWNGSMTQAEVKKAMNGDLEGHSALLHACWKMNEAEGNLVYDYSNNGHDAVLYGGSWTEGRSTYSLVADMPGGGGVLVEEQTLNYIKEPSAPESWATSLDSTYGHVSYTTVETSLGVPAFQKTVKRMTTTDYRGVLTTIPWNTPTSMSTPHTFSLYIRLSSGEPGNVVFNFQGTDSAGARIDVNESHIIDSNEWKRIDLSRVLADNGFATLIPHMKIYTYPSSTADSVSVFELACPQMEAKTYSTSFVDGVRKLSHLEYPQQIFNRQEGTISFWAKAIRKVNHGLEHDHLFYLGDSDGFSGITANKIEFHITRHSDGAIVSQYVANNGTTETLDSVSSPPGSTNVGEWFHVAVAYKHGEAYSLYVDGVKKSTTTLDVLMPPATVDAERMWVGRSAAESIRYSSAIFDELRIDKVARTEAEIKAWYHQGRNGR